MNACRRRNLQTLITLVLVCYGANPGRLGTETIHEAEAPRTVTVKVELLARNLRALGASLAQWRQDMLRDGSLVYLIMIGGNAPPPSPPSGTPLPPPIITQRQPRLNLFGPPIIIDNPTGGGSGDPPTEDAPEPATLVSGLTGALLACCWYLRKRRRPARAPLHAAAENLR